MKQPVVVFLHGLARTHRSLDRLRRHVGARGYETWARTYPSRRLPLADLAALVAGWIRADVGTRPILGVTHSMGGILARHLASALPWRGLIMLAPPNRGSRVAEALGDSPLYRWWFGPAGLALADPRGWPAPPSPFSVIAGTLGVSPGNLPSWLIHAKRILPAGVASDGTVTVDEARLPGMADYAEVPASHTFLMDHPETQRLVVEWLDRCG
jgi:triacylglycerol lipase